MNTCTLVLSLPPREISLYTGTRHQVRIYTCRSIHDRVERDDAYAYVGAELMFHSHANSNFHER